MGIKRRKVTKTTKKLITMKGTRKSHSVAQFSLNAPDIRKKCEGGRGFVVGESLQIT